MTNVIEIVKSALIKSGHDGLYNEDAQCACLIDDLRPCGEDFSTCKPGYKRQGPVGYEYDWTVNDSKE